MRFANAITVGGAVVLTGLVVQTVAAQDVAIGHSSSYDDSGGTLSIQLDNGDMIRIELSNGAIRIDGQEIAQYGRADLANSWRAFVAAAERLNTDEVVAAAKQWEQSAPGLAEQASVAFEAALARVASQESLAVQDEQRVIRINTAQGIRELAERLREISEAATVRRMRPGATQSSVRRELGGLTGLQLDVSQAEVRVGDVEIGRSERIDGSLVILGGDLRLRGVVTGNILSYGGNVRLYEGARVDGDVVSMDGTVTGSRNIVAGTIRSVSTVRGQAIERVRATAPVSSWGSVTRNLMTLLGTIVALASIGFGVTFFAPRQLEIVASHVASNPGKSFLAGLFAQPLLFPALAMLVVGLTISIVGILIIPLAIIAACLVVGTAVVVGYLAVARSIGCKHARLRADRTGKTVSLEQYPTILRGLAFMLAAWLPAVLLSWSPAASIPIAVAAALFTWILATAGFGAVVTTRAGYTGPLVPWKRTGQIADGGTTATR